MASAYRPLLMAGGISSYEINAIYDLNCTVRIIAVHLLDLCFTGNIVKPLYVKLFVSGGVITSYESLCHPSGELGSFVCITCWWSVTLLFELNIMNRETSWKEWTHSLIRCWHWQKSLSLHHGKNYTVSVWKTQKWFSLEYFSYGLILAK